MAPGTRMYNWIRNNRRPITEAVNSLKRRFGDRLHCRGLWNQWQETAEHIRA